MELFIKEITKTEKKMELVILFGVMVQNIMVNFMIIKFMERDCISGLIKEFIKVLGNVIKWRKRVNLVGLMEENIKENIKMIKNMVLEYLNGRIIFKLNKKNK
jgi:hypothetical protein